MQVVFHSPHLRLHTRSCSCWSLRDQWELQRVAGIVLSYYREKQNPAQDSDLHGLAEWVFQLPTNVIGLNENVPNTGGDRKALKKVGGLNPSNDSNLVL